MTELVSDVFVCAVSPRISPSVIVIIYAFIQTPTSWRSEFVHAVTKCYERKCFITVK